MARGCLLLKFMLIICIFEFANLQIICPNDSDTAM
jgi:hypothetical protein